MSRWSRFFMFLLAILMISGWTVAVMHKNIKEVLKRDCNTKECHEKLSKIREALKKPQEENSQDLLCKTSLEELNKSGFWKKNKTALYGFKDNSDHFFLTAILSIGIIFIISFIYLNILFSLNWSEFFFSIVLLFSTFYICEDLLIENRTIKSSKISQINLSCENQ